MFVVDKATLEGIEIKAVLQQENDEQEKEQIDQIKIDQQSDEEQYNEKVNHVSIVGPASRQVNGQARSCES